MSSACCEKFDAETNFVKKLENFVATLGTKNAPSLMEDIFEVSSSRNVSKQFSNHSHSKLNSNNEMPLDLTVNKKCASRTFDCNLVCSDMKELFDSKPVVIDNSFDLSATKRNAISKTKHDFVSNGSLTFYQNEISRQRKDEVDPRSVSRSQIQNLSTSPLWNLSDSDFESWYKNRGPSSSLRCLDCGNAFVTFLNLTLHMVECSHYGNLVQSIKRDQRPNSSDHERHPSSVYKNLKRPRSEGSSPRALLEVIGKKRCFHSPSPNYRLESHRNPAEYAGSQADDNHRCHQMSGNSREQFGSSRVPHLIPLPCFGLKSKHDRFSPAWDTTPPTFCPSGHHPGEFEKFRDSLSRQTNKSTNSSYFDEHDGFPNSACSPLKKLEGMVYGNMSPSSALPTDSLRSLRSLRSFKKCFSFEHLEKQDDFKKDAGTAVEEHHGSLGLDLNKLYVIRKVDKN